MLKIDLRTATVGALGALLIAGTAQATAVSGTVYCDANQNQSIDAPDTILENVEAVVEPGPIVDKTNVIGIYFIDLPNVLPAAYSIHLDSATLPDDGVIVNGPELRDFELTTTMPGAQIDWLVDSAICQESICGDGFIDEGEECDDGNNEDGDGCSAICEDEGGEGCTPGYWKQEHHFDSYAAPYTPNTLFSDVFEDAFPGMSLVEVASQGGGGLKALGRHTVAALLSAASGDVDYPLTAQQVIDTFNAVFPGYPGAYGAPKDLLESYNEAGCPLN